MSRKTLLLMLLPLMLACKTLVPGTAPQTPPTPRPTVAISLPAIRGSGTTFVRLEPGDGKLTDLLAAEAQKAAALRQIPVVEFDAPWCPACQAISSSLEAHETRMVNAFKGVYLIRLDADEWGWDLEKDGFSFEAIPIFFKLDSQGQSNGEVIDGGAWGENIPENMAPPLDKFFHGN